MTVPGPKWIYAEMNLAWLGRRLNILNIFKNVQQLHAKVIICIVYLICRRFTWVLIVFVIERVPSMLLKLHYQLGKRHLPSVVKSLGLNLELLLKNGR